MNKKTTPASALNQTSSDHDYIRPRIPRMSWVPIIAFMCMTTIARAFHPVDHIIWTPSKMPVIIDIKSDKTY